MRLTKNDDMIQGVARWLSERFALIESNCRCWGPNGGFRMGVAGWRFAHGKRNLSGRAAIVAVLKDWQVICLAAGSMIMLGIMLYNDLQQ